MTPKLKSHILNPLYLAEKSSDIFTTSNFDVTVDPFDDERTVRFLGVVDEANVPLRLTSLYYLTNLADESLGLMDAIVTLSQGKTINELKTMTMKELDYYLRLNTHEPAFKYYHDNHYKLLKCMEKIALYIEEKKQTLPWHKVERSGPYESLPDFEKLDLIDEILARFIVIPKIIKCDIWCEDVEGNTIFLNNAEELTEKEKTQIQHILFYHLCSERLRVVYL